MKHLSALLLTSTVLMATASPALANGSITLTHQGKVVDAIPVDQLGQVEVTVKVPGSFKNFYKGQWGSLNHSFGIHAKYYKTGTAVPSLANSTDWPSQSIAESFDDASWPDKTSLSTSFLEIAKRTRAHAFDDTHSVLLTGHYAKQFYTGKTVYQGGGWVKETNWATMKPALGQAKLKLQPPTFANTLQIETIAKDATNNLNTKQDDSSMESALYMGRRLFYPTSYGGTKVDFTGTKILSFEKAGTPHFSWNYSGDQELVYVAIPVTAKIHAQVIKSGDNHPIPLKAEADFVCPNAELSAKRPVNGGNWTFSSWSLREDSGCRSTEGKTAEQVLSAATPTADKLLQGNPLDQAKDLMNILGF